MTRIEEYWNIDYFFLGCIIEFSISPPSKSKEIRHILWANVLVNDKLH